MRQHLCTVQTCPVKGGIWEAGDIVPRELSSADLGLASLSHRDLSHLLRHEVIQSSQPQNLRQLTRIPKGIRQESFATVRSESIAKVSLSVQILPHKTLTRWHHAIVLQPRATDIVESPFLDVFLDPGEPLGVERLEPQVLLGRRRGELVVGPTIHQITLRSPTSGDLGSAPRRSGTLPSVAFACTAKARRCQYGYRQLSRTGDRTNVL